MLAGRSASENVALAACADDGELAGVVRYSVDPATSLGDVAFIVAQPWRGAVPRRIGLDTRSSALSLPTYERLRAECERE